MTTPYMTSRFSTGIIRRHRRVAENLYSVQIEGFDGESRSFEVMADSYEKAAAEAENLAFCEGIQVQNMNIYTF
jgi:hypothetical protein